MTHYIEVPITQFEGNERKRAFIDLTEVIGYCEGESVGKTYVNMSDGGTYVIPCGIDAWSAFMLEFGHTLSNPFLEPVEPGIRRVQ